MAVAFFFASALELAPQARSDKSRRVGSPFLYSGPGIPPIRAKNDARRGLSPDLTGRFKFMPWALAERRPASFRPPFGFLPALRVQAGEAINDQSELTLFRWCNRRS